MSGGQQKQSELRAYSNVTRMGDVSFKTAITEYLEQHARILGGQLWRPPHRPYSVKVVVYRGTAKGGIPRVVAVFEGDQQRVKRAMVQAGHYDKAHSGLGGYREPEEGGA